MSRNGVCLRHGLDGTHLWLDGTPGTPVVQAAMAHPALRDIAQAVQACSPQVCIHAVTQSVSICDLFCEGIHPTSYPSPTFSPVSGLPRLCVSRAPCHGCHGIVLIAPLFSLCSLCPSCPVATPHLHAVGRPSLLCCTKPLPTVPLGAREDCGRPPAAARPIVTWGPTQVLPSLGEAGLLT